jgi:central glycolytic genes regulator
LGYQKIIVVPGDSDKDPNVKRELGNVAALYLSSVIRSRDVIALTGGSTIKEMVTSFPKMDFRDNLIVPARGSLGKILDIQSNNVVAALAEKVNAGYKLLNVPDNLSSESLEVLLKEREIKEVVDLIRKAQIVVLGIGRADKMAKRRGLSEDEISELMVDGAVGEAFGAYFGKNGRVIRKINSVGVSLDDFSKVRHLIAVTGGSSKAEAIEAVRLKNDNAVLITDEGAARKIVSILKSQYNEF